MLTAKKCSRCGFHVIHRNDEDRCIPCMSDLKRVGRVVHLGEEPSESFTVGGRYAKETSDVDPLEICGKLLLDERG